MGTDNIGPEHVGSSEVRKIFDQRKVLPGQASKAQGAGFKDVMKDFITEVNDLQLEAEDKIEKLASGEIKDLNEVMVATTEADTSFKIMMDIRNRLMAAYKEISKMGGN